MKNESFVVSVRVPKAIYEMLQQITKMRLQESKTWISQYGPAFGVQPDITASLVAKELLCNAIGKEYTERINK